MKRAGITTELVSDGSLWPPTTVSSVTGGGHSSEHGTAFTRVKSEGSGAKGQEGERGTMA